MDSLSFLLGLYGYVDVFLLILVRMLGFFIILPIFSGQNIPMAARVSLSVYMAFLLITSQFISITYNNSVPAYVLLIIKEFLVGFILAFVVYMIFSIINFAGQLIDYQIGFSMVSVFDPVSQIQVPITGNLIYLIICALMIQTGGLNTIVNSIFQSYILLPAGQANLLGNSGLLENLVKMLISYITLGVKISTPIIGSIIILDIALGLLVKAVPQMNIFAVGMPIKLIVGLFILVAVASNFFAIFEMVFYESMKAISNVLRSISP